MLLPAYNAAAYIGTAIASVLRQTHGDWELLVVDDGSSDETAAVAAAYTDPRVRVIRARHGGVSAARNVALAEMTGDAFVLLDADDQLTPHSLAARLAILQSRAEVEFVDGAVEFTDQDLGKTTSVYRPTLRGRPFADLVALSGSCYAGPYWMTRRVTSKTYHFNEGMTHCEDLLFYITLSAGHSGLYDFTDTITARVRRGHQSAMSNLAGLEHGYRMLYAEVARRGIAHPEQLHALGRRIRRIVWRSYAKRGDWRSALRSLVRPVDTRVR